MARLYWLKHQPQTYHCPVNRLRKWWQYLTRTMETQLSGKTVLDAPKVRMTTCRIQVEPVPTSQDYPAPVFLYQEQALTTKLDQPYRQRFLRIESSKTDNGVISRTFKPTQLEPWTGLCQRSSQTRIITQENMGTEICQVRLQRQPAGDRYIGKTPPEGCPTSYRGAVRITKHRKA